MVVNTTVVQHNSTMSREDAQFKLRLAADLRDKIADAAADNGRSLNAEISFRLENSFRPLAELTASEAEVELSFLRRVIRMLDDETGALSKAIEMRRSQLRQCNAAQNETEMDNVEPIAFLRQPVEPKKKQRKK
jgi:hypothetical protein